MQKVRYHGRLFEIQTPRIRYAGTAPVCGAMKNRTDPYVKKAVLPLLQVHSICCSVSSLSCAFVDVHVGGWLQVHSICCSVSVLLCACNDVHVG